jgi:hypothetical protein
MAATPRARSDAAPAPCRCGHDAFDHEHYRRGRECGRCECPAYRSRSGMPVRVVAGLRTAVRRFAGR